VNIKKLFPEKSEPRKGLLEFLDKKGFYVVLILCIAIVGATAVFVTTSNITSPKLNYDAQKMVPEEADKGSAANVDQKVSNPSAVNAVQGKQEQKNAPGKPADTAKPPAQGSPAKAQPQKDNKNVDTPKKAAPKESAGTGKDQKFIMPVPGEVSFEYAQDRLVYSKTLEEWRTHSGVDLAADRGTPVKAAADGTVSEIKSDPRFGVTILVDHQNGIKTVYANLAADDMVTPNQKVKQGDVIGSIGNSAYFESAERPHLHFEVLKNDEPVNPADYLPKK